MENKERTQKVLGKKGHPGVNQNFARTVPFLLLFVGIERGRHPACSLLVPCMWEDAVAHVYFRLQDQT